MQRHHDEMPILGVSSFGSAFFRGLSALHLVVRDAELADLLWKREGRRLFRVENNEKKVFFCFVHSFFISCFWILIDFSSIRTWFYSNIK